MTTTYTPSTSKIPFKVIDESITQEMFDSATNRVLVCLTGLIDHDDESTPDANALLDGAVTMIKRTVSTDEDHVIIDTTSFDAEDVGNLAKLKHGFGLGYTTFAMIGVEEIASLFDADPLGPDDRYLTTAVGAESLASLFDATLGLLEMVSISLVDSTYMVAE